MGTTARLEIPALLIHLDYPGSGLDDALDVMGMAYQDLLQKLSWYCLLGIKASEVACK